MEDARFPAVPARQAGRGSRAARRPSTSARARARSASASARRRAQSASTAAARAAAFAAAEFLMDYLKSRAPFWKKETGPAGSSWVEAKAEDEAALDRWSR